MENPTLKELLDTYEKAAVGLEQEAKHNALAYLPKEVEERIRVLSAFQQEVGYRHVGAELLLLAAKMESRRLATRKQT